MNLVVLEPTFHAFWHVKVEFEHYISSATFVVKIIERAIIFEFPEKYWRVWFNLTLNADIYPKRVSGAIIVPRMCPDLEVIPRSGPRSPELLSVIYQAFFQVSLVIDTDTVIRYGN